jgi:thiol-disulfide isomerase/thioredoxin
MMLRFFLLLVAILMVSVSPTNAQKGYRTYTIAKLMDRIENEDTAYVLNFWATWCAPCVKELPDFEKINEEYKKRGVKVLLVSLDFKTDVDNGRLTKKIQELQLKSEVIWLNETNANHFVPKINESWGGAIPYTMIAFEKYTRYIEGSTSYEFLKEEINELLFSDF